jgi:hypothetical protein
MSELIEVKVSELSGAALDWAVMVCVKGEKTKHEFEDGKLYLVVSKQLMGHCQEMSEPFMPSTRWQEGGPLIEKYGVLISPKESPIHVNGGPNAGWQESGSWGATIFRKGEHRRKAHNHPDEPLVAAMRCVVNWVLGPVVSVPKELIHE